MRVSFFIGISLIWFVKSTSTKLVERKYKVQVVQRVGPWQKDEEIRNPKYSKKNNA